MKKIDTILTQLREEGERITAIRRALVEILHQSVSPISVQDIITALAKRKLHANKTTVYRQIETLQKYNLIHEVRLADRSLRYELAGADNHHHHLVCLRCDTIQDIAFDDDLKRQEKAITRRKQFTVLHHSLEFFGVCARCRA